MKPKKILMAIGSLSGGGAERVASVWASQLTERGHDVSILVFVRKKDEYPVSNKVKIYSCANTIEEYLSKSFVHRFKEVRSIVKIISPDYSIAFFHNMRILMMLTLFGLRTKRIDTLRISPWSLQKSSLSWSNRCLSRLSFDTANKIIIQASDQRPWFSKRNQKKCVLIPNPISDIYTTSFREEISHDVVNFIAAGRIVPQKNYPMMINAFARVVQEYPQVQLSIFGTGVDDYAQSLQDQINLLGMQNNIFLMGRSTHIEDEYKKRDVFLMSSDYEGLPNALMEAMASRLICISTNCKTGPSDLIEEGVNGYMIPVGDNEALAEAIIKVINMPYEERVTMADAARHKIMTYCSHENSLNRLCSILK